MDRNENFDFDVYNGRISIRSCSTDWCYIDAETFFRNRENHPAYKEYKKKMSMIEFMNSQLEHEKQGALDALLNDPGDYKECEYCQADSMLTCLNCNIASYYYKNKDKQAPEKDKNA